MQTNKTGSLRFSAIDPQDVKLEQSDGGTEFVMGGGSAPVELTFKIRDKKWLLYVC